MGELERDARWCNAVHNNPQLIVGEIILATHSISPFVLMGGWSGLIYDCFHSLGIEIVMRVEAPTFCLFLLNPMPQSTSGTCIMCMSYYSRSLWALRAPASTLVVGPSSALLPSVSENPVVLTPADLR